MIYAFTGKTGSGKTFSMVKMAHEKWLEGTDIYSNTILFFSAFNQPHRINIADNPDLFTLWERFKYSIIKLWGRTFKKQIEPFRRGKIVYFQEIQEIIEITDGIVLFDEAQVLFNARNWESLPDVFQYKLQQSRKHKIDLLCTTQNIKRIDIVYRELIHRWFHFEKMWSFGEPMIIGNFKQLEKDLDEYIDGQGPELVPVINEKTFLIHKWKMVNLLFAPIK